MDELLEGNWGTIRLRSYRALDAALIFAAVRASAAEIAPWMGWCHPGYSLDDAVAWTALCVAGEAEGTAYAFSLVEEATGTIVGDCGLNQINRVHGFANCGYWIRTGYTGRGLASAAARRVARFGLTTLGLSRIEIVVSTRNLASQRVAERAGAAREGVLRDRLATRDGPEDVVMFSIVRRDLR